MTFSQPTPPTGSGREMRYRFREYFITIVILLTALVFGWGDPNQLKLTTLLVAGCACLGILMFTETGSFLSANRSFLGVLLFLVAAQILRPTGMSLVSLAAFFCIACFLGLLCICDRVPDIYIKGAICTAAIVQALYGIMQVWYDPIFSSAWANPSTGYTIPESWRIMGTFGQRQFWLMFLTASVPLFFYTGLNKWFRRAGLGVIGIAYCLYYYVLREIGFVEIAAGMVLLVYLSRRIAWIWLVPLLITLTVFCYQYRGQLYNNSFLWGKIIVPVELRVKIAKLTYELTTRTWSSALVGYGLGTYKHIMPAYEKQPEKQIYPQHVLASAHNEYLQAWFELGILGLVGILALFVFILIQCLATIDSVPYWYSLLFVGLFSWVHFPLHLPFMAVFFLKGNDRVKGQAGRGFYSGCPETLNKVRR